jgi:hypothetical protein
MYSYSLSYVLIIASGSVSLLFSLSIFHFFGRACSLVSFFDTVEFLKTCYLVTFSLASFGHGEKILMCFSRFPLFICGEFQGWGVG